jgi:hypothetical protein
MSFGILVHTQLAQTSHLQGNSKFKTSKNNLSSLQVLKKPKVFLSKHQEENKELWWITNVYLEVKG